MRQAPHESAADRRPTLRQLVMREVNLKIFELGSRRNAIDSQYEFVCECAEPDCSRTVRLHLHRFDPTMPAGTLLAHASTRTGQEDPLT